VEWISDQRIDRLREFVKSPADDDGRYEIREEVGRGGMGTVYRAEDTRLRRDVALKVLNQVSDPAGAAERMRKEALILARLEHPGIVPIHDAGALPDGRLFYAMKLVRGKRLDEYCEQPYLLHDLLRIFQRICEPVAFAHSRGILHRDLKPQNIIVGEFGEVLVLDWGVAKVLGSPASVTDTDALAQTAEGTVIGTRGYMAPEQARGNHGEVDQRSDIYSLGKMLGFLIARTRPVSKPPKRLKAIWEKAIANERLERYPNVADLASDIGLFLDGRPVSAYRENLFEQAWGWIARHQLISALVLAYILMRAGLIFFLGR
jgi:eukaryotic-like serine/threonine-protein kinase